MFKPVSIVLVILPLLLISSCSHSICEDCQSSPVNDSELITQLQAYNDLMAEGVSGTRGFGRFCAIAGADLLGAYEGGKIGIRIGGAIGGVCGGHAVEGAIVGGVAGGVICGVGGSYAAYCSTRAALTSSLDTQVLLLMVEEGVSNISEIRNQINPNVVGSDDLILPQEPIDVGVLHNYILNDILNNDTNSLDANSDTDISPLDSLIFNSSELLAATDSTISVYEREGVSIESKNLPDLVMNLYQDIFNKCSDSYEDVVACINSYYEMIKNSDELTEDEKLCIYTGLSVSLYSLNYWNGNGN